MKPGLILTRLISPNQSNAQKTIGGAMRPKGKKFDIWLWFVAKLGITQRSHDYGQALFPTWHGW